MQPRVQLAEPGKGNGLFATQCYSKGESVTKDCLLDHPLSFVNHSCDPNCDIKMVTLYAKRDIAIGEEITIDYDTVQFFRRVTPPFTCLCKSPNCRGQVDERINK